jgi:hypothetical protein
MSMVGSLEAEVTKDRFVRRQLEANDSSGSPYRNDEVYREREGSQP